MADLTVGLRRLRGWALAGGVLAAAACASAPAARNSRPGDGLEIPSAKAAKYGGTGLEGDVVMAGVNHNA